MDTVFIEDKGSIILPKIWNDATVRQQLLLAAPLFFATYYDDLYICGPEEMAIRIGLRFEEASDDLPTDERAFEQLVADTHPLDIEIDWKKSMAWSEAGVAEVKRCLKDAGVHLIVTPYLIGYTVSSNRVILSHACGLVIDKCRKTVELYDPNGASDHTLIYKDWDYSFFKDNRGLGRMLRGYKLLKPAETCPPLGFQHAVTAEVGEGMCAIWSIFMLHLRIVNHSMSASEFSALLSSLQRAHDASYFTDFIQRYTSHVYPLIRQLL